MDNEKQQWMQENYPFFSYVRYGNKKEFTEHLGIIINSDQVITSMYNFEAIPTPELRKKFIELGEQWWWESNRMIPINIFLKTEMQRFTYCMMTMNTKDVKISVGPCVNLNNLSKQKNTKEKVVQVLRKTLIRKLNYIMYYTRHSIRYSVCLFKVVFTVVWFDPNFL